MTKKLILKLNDNKGKERYIPTPEDIKRAQIPVNSIRLSGDGIFHTVQGEGLFIGQPATFIRLQGCNLRCGFCDTWYAVDPTRPEYWAEPTIVTIKVL